ncbi:GNAT family N-acetyltransferase [Brevundimonas bacteroides]|uniref:GNAT family N-acetyltransferase n=1 Tax=Brevundimonas bacteroides TaxID=74311 RepID=UPI000496CEF2|nr:GNAT family N-acetyltransferase [Brevundimonas bacteroides]
MKDFAQGETLYVRATRSDDLPALRQIIDSTGLFPGEMIDDMATPFLTESGSADRWLTLDDGEPIGVAYFAPERMTAGTWNLLLIAIRSDRQGQGLGARLIDAVEQALASDGQRVLLVETSGLPEFERTRAFYDGRHYRREAVIHDFYQAGEDKVVFWKRLDS